jgi:hypothetical protein
MGRTDVLLILCVSLAGLAAMAILYQEDIQAPAVPITVVTTAETLVVVSNNVTTPNPNGKAAVRGWLDITVGTGATSLTIAIYQGAAIGGPLVGTKNPEAGDFTPGSTAHFEVEFISLFNNVGSVQFCMSVTQTGASGNGSVVAALLDTKVLSG